MEVQVDLLELNEILSRLFDEMNALDLMVLGLEQTQDPYAGGFNAVYIRFRELTDEIKRLLDSAAQKG